MKHDGEGGPAKKRPLRHLSRPGALLSNRPSTGAEPRWPSSRLGGGPGGLPPDASLPPRPSKRGAALGRDYHAHRADGYPATPIDLIHRACAHGPSAESSAAEQQLETCPVAGEATATTSISYASSASSRPPIPSAPKTALAIPRSRHHAALCPAVTPRELAPLDSTKSQTNSPGWLARDVERRHVSKVGRRDVRSYQALRRETLSLFTEAEVEALGWQSGFYRRKPREIRAFDFALATALGAVVESKRGFASVWRLLAAALGVEVARSAVTQRFGSGSAKLLEQLFHQTLARLPEEPCSRVAQKAGRVPGSACARWFGV